MEDEAVTIVEPTKEVLEKAQSYIQLLQKILPNSKITLIGSLAIPVCVKNEMDVLIEIDAAEDILTTQERIRDESGGDLFGVGPIVDGEGFSRTKKKHGFICELHILHTGDPKIQKYLYRNQRFASDPALARAYDQLKRSLVGKPMSQYKQEKRIFFTENNLD